MTTDQDIKTLPTIHVDPEIYKGFRALCAKRGIGMRQLIKFWIAREVQRGIRDGEIARGGNMDINS